VSENNLFNEILIRRYDVSGPRYTSYPTAVQFRDDFDGQSYAEAVTVSNENSQRAATPQPLSLYFHIPFCDTVCFYCGCNKVVTKDRSKAAPYLERLHKEIEMQAAIFNSDRPVDQLHWGGGTPTFISHQEIETLMSVTRQHFNLHDDDSGEYSIELDPREVTDETLGLLRKVGFNRVSLGVQDFDAQVQKAVNRIQSEEKTLAVINEARKLGFKSISVDLIYGLPFQTQESFATTVEKIIEVSPDRVSVFNYAHLPEMFKPQRRINVDDLPSASEKLAILKLTMEQFAQNGYIYIGMDHFAKPEDELAVAQKNNTLYRNFQGYSTHADCDLIAMGITSINQVGNSYSQNVKTLDEYYERIDAGVFPIYRGIKLDADDLLRRAVITQLICHFKLEFKAIEDQFNIKFPEYFAMELSEFGPMINDGLVKIDDHVIDVLPPGRLLIRNICMIFDKYLRETKSRSYSKVI